MRARFEDLQAALEQRLAGRGLSDIGAGTIVVIPSVSFPVEELRKITAIEYYEERMLFTLLMLDKPGIRIVYTTSLPVEAAIVDYYLSFVDAADAKSRLQMIAVGDRRVGALSGKLLGQPEALDRLRAAIGDPSDAYILPFNVGPLERAVAERLGVPIWGPHPGDVWLGSKSGSRHVARKAGVAVFDGAEDLRSVEELAVGIEAIRALRPEAEAVVIKLNNGFSGQGNAIIDLSDVRSPLEDSPTTFCGAGESWSTFGPKVAADGAIVEELVRAPGVVSPSVQMRIAPGGSFEVVSTHDQILGGPDGQVYLGCRFPARAGYRLGIQEAAVRVTEVLAAAGVFGGFGMDFVVVPDRGIFLTEINLRAGGTTHPFLMARFATKGCYDAGSGELLVDGQPKSYIATDNLKSPDYVGLEPGGVIASLDDAGLAYERGTRAGVMLHLLGALRDYGKLGMTCIANSIDEAADLQGAATAVLEDLGRARSGAGS